MTFLNPAAGIIAGAIAAPILLLLYFLKLRRRPVRVSSTLLWERAVEDLQVNEPFRWLRPSWLLLIQMLALASLCVALALPAIDAPEAPASRVVLLLDTSASMSASDAGDGVTRVEAARARATDLVNRLAAQPGDGFEAAVIAFAAEPRALTGLTPSAAELRAAIDSVEPTDQPGDLGAALKLASAIARQSGVGAASARIVVIGDGAYGAVQAAAAGVRFIRVGPEPASARDNVGIAAIAVRRGLDDASLVRVFARLVNASDGPIAVPVTLLLDGESVETRTLSMPGASDGGAGESAVTFEFTDTPTGEPRLATVYVGREDTLPADNAAAARLEPTIPPRVLVVVPPVMDDAQRIAVSLLVGAPEAVGSTIIDLIDSARYDALETTPGALSRYDLIVFNGGRVAWLAPIPTIAFGTIVGDAQTPRTEGPIHVASWRRSHPLLRQVSLDGLVIARARGLTLPDDPTGAVTGEEIASGPDGPLMMEITDHGVRRIVVGFDLAQSNWPTQPGFVIFMVNAIERLTRLIGEATAATFTTTTPITVRPTASVVRAEGPVEIERAVEPGAGSLELGVLPRAGVYRLTGVQAGDRLIPVNVASAEESAIATADALDLAGGTATAAGVGAAAPREVWRWFTLAGFVLLSLEWLLFAWRMRV